MLRLSLFASMFGVAVGVMGCGSHAADTPVSGDDELNATSNLMGMRLVYDDPSGHVLATVKPLLRAGEKLRMGVRRGRLVVGGQSQLDCTQLAEAPLMAPGSYTASRAATSVVYQGPELDRALLASVYSQQWIDANISPAVLQQLSRDGADAIVEACIMASDASVRMRLQTSIQDAWDASDPNTAPALRAQKLAAFAHP